MKTTKKYLLAIIFSPLIFLFGCVEVSLVVEGNGRLSSEFRALPYFNALDVTGAFKVRVEAGDAYEVKISAESNLQEYIATKVYGSKLEIAVDGIDEIEATLPIEILVITPRLDDILLEGDGSVYVANFFDVKEANVKLYGSGTISAAFDCDNLNVKVIGAGQVELEGTAIESNLVVDGAGEILNYDMLARYNETTINGSGRVYVNVSRRLDVVIRGSGNVNYINDPFVTTDIIGIGRVIHHISGKNQVNGKLHSKRIKMEFNNI